MSQTRIPLEVLRIENPCPADWDQMVGDDRRRFCQGCQKHVHNLTAMPRAEAERLVCESAGRLCVRFARDAAGAVVTVDYQNATDARRRGWRFWTGVGLVGALFAGAANVWYGRSTAVTGMRVVTMGDFRPPTTAPSPGGSPGTTYTAPMMGGICPPVPGSSSAATQPVDDPVSARDAVPGGQ